MLFAVRKVGNMTTFRLEPQYLYKLSSMPRGFTTHTALNNRCNIPFNTITIDHLGNCLICECDGWLPLPVGKVRDFATIQDVFSSPAARLIQEDVSQGKFSWCAVDHCGIRSGDKIKDFLNLSINIDESCNLHCPSCRRNPVMISQGPEYDSKLSDVERIVSWLETYTDPVNIIMSGNGDPLASRIMRPLIKQLNPKPNQKFTIFTNGLLIKKQLCDSTVWANIENFKISIDAGSRDVYQDVRRPGNWDVLLQNLDYVRDMGKSSKTLLNFALQKKNYQDLPGFVKLCQHYGFVGNVHQLDDWGTWGQMESEQKDRWTIQNGRYRDQDVLNKAHPEHAQCMSILKEMLGEHNICFSHAIMLQINNEI